MLDKWRRLSRELRSQNRWWKYYYDQVELPSGKAWEYHFIQTPGSVMVVPVTADNQLLMLKQYRYLADDVLLEFPAGGMKEGESPAAAAHRELVEETGHDGDLEFIGRFMPWNGVSSEYCHVYLARRLKPSQAHVQEEEEQIEPEKISIADFEAKILAQEIPDGMSLAVWSLARPHLLK